MEDRGSAYSFDVGGGNGGILGKELQLMWVEEKGGVRWRIEAVHTRLMWVEER